MADNTERTLVLSLQFDTDEGLKRAANFRQAVDENKKALQELNKTIKESGEVTEEQALQREKLEQQIREGNRARADQLRQIDNYIKATKGAIDADGKYNGSIKNLRGSLGFLTEQWNGLTRAERENKDVGGVLQAEIKSLSDQLKELEGSVGDNRRSVGGYLDAIKQAPGFMGKMSAGMQGLNGVMAANPIGAVVQLLNTLMPILNSSGDSADFLAKTMAQINAVIQVGMKYLIQFGGRAVEAGKEAFEAFSNPKQVLIDLSEFIQTNLTNRFKSFGVILEGIKNLDFKKVSDGVIQMGTGVTNATDKIGNLATAARNGFNQIAADVDKAVKAGGAYAEQLDELEAKERAFGVASAKTQKEIDKLLIASRSRGKTEEERIALLEKAETLEIRNNKQALAMANERLALVKQQNALNQEDADAQDQRLKDAETAVIELEQQSQNILEKIQIRKDALEQQRIADFEKNKAETIKFLEETNKILSEAAGKSEEELREARQKAQQEQMNASKKVVDQQIADAKAGTAEEIRLSNLKIAQKQKEFAALNELANAGQALFAALAKENEAFAEFDKALTLFKIGLASAEAITKGISASQSVPFPGNLIAMATTVATVGANLLQAKQLIDQETPKFTAAEGGLLEGPSHAAGGIRGTGRFANVEVEGGEAVISKRATAMYAPLLSIINQLGGGKPLGPTNYAAMGGMLSTGIYSGATTPAGPVIDYDKLAKTISKQPIYVIPTEIRDKANAADARKARAGLGYNRS